MCNSNYVFEHLLQLRNITLRGERRKIHPIILQSQTQTQDRTNLQRNEIKKAMETEWLQRIQCFNSDNPLNDTDIEEWQMKMDNLIHEYERMNLA